MQAIADFFKGIWGWISSHALNLWAGIAAAIIAVLSFLNINAPGWLSDYTTTAPQTTITTTTTTTATAAPVNQKTVTIAQIEAAGLDEHTAAVSSLNSFGTTTTYNVSKGVLLADILTEVFEVSLSELGSNAYLVVIPSDSPSKTTTYDYSLLSHAGAILASAYTSITDEDPPVSKTGTDTPRLFPGNSGDSTKFVKYVDQLELHW